MSYLCSKPRVFLHPGCNTMETEVPFQSGPNITCLVSPTCLLGGKEGGEECGYINFNAGREHTHTRTHPPHTHTHTHRAPLVSTIKPLEADRHGPVNLMPHLLSPRLIIQTFSTTDTPSPPLIAPESTNGLYFIPLVSTHTH